jgi:hypothetical protein
MPFFDRDYGDRGLRSRGGGGKVRDPSRNRGGGIMRHREGRMPHDQHQLTGRGGHGGRNNGHPMPQPHHGMVGNTGRGGRR